MKVLIFGASGAIGRAFVQSYEQDHDVIAVSRTIPDDTASPAQWRRADMLNSDDMTALAQSIKEQGTVDRIIVASGILHGEGLRPEKALRDLDVAAFERVLAVNTYAPAMVMKHFLPLLPRDKAGVFAALSARVGSISDNHLGGWYAYRASKAALNMIIKTAAIEVARKHSLAAVVGLHPGTVDSTLSQPFQGHVPEGKLFHPDHSVAQMREVIESRTAVHTGRCFAYDGTEIAP